MCSCVALQLCSSVAFLTRIALENVQFQPPISLEIEKDPIEFGNFHIQLATSQWDWPLPTPIGKCVLFSAFVWILRKRMQHIFNIFNQNAKYEMGTPNNERNCINKSQSIARLSTSPSRWAAPYACQICVTHRGIRNHMLRWWVFCCHFSEAGRGIYFRCCFSLLVVPRLECRPQCCLWKMVRDSSADFRFQVTSLRSALSGSC